MCAKTRRRACGSIFTIVALLASPRTTFAHRDDYISETLVYLTLERHELEAEYWLDYGRDSAANADFSRNNFAFEWGITDSWMVDGRGSIVSPDDDSTRFDSARLESRYRFFEEGTLPVDLAASFEVNTEREEDGSTTVGIEPRAILSKDFGEELNLTANLSEEIPLDSGSPKFLLALGARWKWTELLRVGAEFQFNAEDDTGSVIPQVWLTLPYEVTVKLGYAVGIDDEPEDFARLAVEVGL